MSQQQQEAALISPEECVKPERAAEIMALSPEQIRLMVRTGVLFAYRTGSKGSRMSIPLRAIGEYQQRQREEFEAKKAARPAWVAATIRGRKRA